MNNAINSVNNVSFGSRYLNVDSLEKVPPRISKAILQSDAIDEFIKAGKPKTLWEKFIDLFKKDEMLDVYHNVAKDPLNPDPYAQEEFLQFAFGDKVYKNKKFPIKESQCGIEREAGSIPKPNEHYRFKPPFKTSEDKIVERIENIEDFGKLLK